MPSIVCIHCKKYLESELSLYFQDLKFEVNLEDKSILVYGDEINLKNVIKKIEELGYIVEG